MATAMKYDTKKIIETEDVYEVLKLVKFNPVAEEVKHYRHCLAMSETVETDKEVLQWTKMAAQALNKIQEQYVMFARLQVEQYIDEIYGLEKEAKTLRKLNDELKKKVAEYESKSGPDYPPPVLEGVPQFIE